MMVSVIQKSLAVLEFAAMKGVIIIKQLYPCLYSIDSQHLYSLEFTPRLALIASFDF
ncbi:hypothetical protein SAMN04487941_4021 [Pontibacter akesuensis]|uniref:Uncharacterized protein n=1 Tax=Pontibacter akesuensis TaxID=388950 RepID=A0A1I7KR33_9BACT|nr:hypothetical protein SAMN04487941_4021 [Pontibacter akesuensis]